MQREGVQRTHRLIEIHDYAATWLAHSNLNVPEDVEKAWRREPLKSQQQGRRGRVMCDRSGATQYFRAILLLHPYLCPIQGFGSS